MVVRIHLGVPVENFIINRIGVAPKNLHSTTVGGSLRAVGDASEGISLGLGSVSRRVEKFAADSGATELGKTAGAVTRLIALPTHLLGNVLTFVGNKIDGPPVHHQPPADTGVQFQGWEMNSNSALFQGKKVIGAPDVLTM
jgi:hypothetical protein